MLVEPPLYSLMAGYSSCEWMSDLYSRSFTLNGADLKRLIEFNEFMSLPRELCLNLPFILRALLHEAHDVMRSRDCLDQSCCFHLALIFLISVGVCHFFCPEWETFWRHITHVLEGIFSKQL